MDAFLELGKRSLLPFSDVLRGFFDTTLDHGKPARALKGKCKTCQRRINLREDRMCAHYHGYAGPRTSARTLRPKLSKSYWNTMYFVRTNVKSDMLLLLLVGV